MHKHKLKKKFKGKVLTIKSVGYLIYFFCAWKLFHKTFFFLLKFSRIEQLWRDLWAAVTCIYYDVLHYPEEEGFLSITNETHLFCHFVFLPRLQDDLDTFRNDWDNHPMRTESHMTPNQLWELGRTHYPIPGPDNTEVHANILWFELIVWFKYLSNLIRSQEHIL